MATLSEYTLLLDSLRPGAGVPLANIGTALVVCNINSEVATVNPTDPWLKTADASHANIRPVAVPDGARFLEVYHTFQSTTDLRTTALTAAPIVQAFGLLPFDFPSPTGVGPIWPYDVTPASFLGPTHNTPEGGEGFFIPLADPTATSSASRYLVTVGAAHTVSSAILPLCNYDVANATAASRILMSAPALFEVGGCRKIQVHVSTAATIQGTALGMLLARFVR